MTSKVTAITGCGLTLAMLVASYLVSARLYRAHVPLEVNLAEREARLGSYLISNQQVELGRALCQDAVRRYPDASEAHLHLAFLHEREQKIPEAVEEYRAAIRCRPDWSIPHVNLGILLGRAGRLEEAAAEFRLGGDDPTAKYNLEMTERALRDRQRMAPRP